MSPIRPCISSLSHFRPIVWYCILNDRSNMSPIRPCISSLSYFRPIVWYCILKDRSNMGPLGPCISSLDHFRPTVWYCILNDRSTILVFELKPHTLMFLWKLWAANRPPGAVFKASIRLLGSTIDLFFNWKLLFYGF